MGSSIVGGKVVAFLLALVGIVFWEARAAAVELADRDLHLRFGDGEAVVCVLVPASLWDERACAGIDRTTLGVRATAVEADIVALAVLRQDGWGVVLAVVRDTVSPGLFERRDASAWLEGLRMGVREGLGPGVGFRLAPPTVTTVNGVSIVGTEMHVEAPPGDLARGFLGYASIDGVMTRSGAYVITFAGPADRAVETNGVAAATLLTLRARPGRVGESAYRLARVVALAAAGVVAVPAGLTLLVLLVRTLLRSGPSRSRRSPARTRPSTPPSSFRVPPSLFTQRLRPAHDHPLDGRSVPFRALLEGSRTLPTTISRNTVAMRPK